mmetsp:Transcript_40934/g.97209  ORF Transcript_40934/g.97209 Transcript_40934/m.97209 type:complete len:93 (+) Transcript_40934:76-354(+)
MSGSDMHSISNSEFRFGTAGCPPPRSSAFSLPSYATRPGQSLAGDEHLQGEKEKTAKGDGSSLGQRRRDTVQAAQCRHQLGQLLDLEPKSHT